jgi:DNA helicase HerA-like ATPase
MARLAGADAVWMAAIEITAIPHVSILGSQRASEAAWIEEYKRDAARLLTEIHQQYRISYRPDGTRRDIALELLWCALPVVNQPFKARIRLFLILRCLDSDEAAARLALEGLTSICRFSLDLERYEQRLCPWPELAGVIEGVDEQAAFVVTRTERVENLLNQAMPACYAWDRLPVTSNDLARITNTLIEHPNTAVSLQLIPTVLTAAESNCLESVSQGLETLRRGVYDGSMMTQVSLSAAARPAESYRYFTDNKDGAIFSFKIIVYGAHGAAHTTASRMIGQLDVRNELRIIPLTATEIQFKRNFYPLPWAMEEALLGLERSFDPARADAILAGAYRLPTLVTAEEASEFFRLPIGSDRLSAGFAVNESSRTGRTFRDELIDASEFEVGMLKSSGLQHSIGFSRADLTKHMLICGTPGSGKTTYSVGMLDRLWKLYGIPFLVIEPAKNEYRALVQSIPELQVFTPGKSFISPFVFNPFVPPKNVRLEAWKSTLKTAFEAGVAMTTPLDKIFEESVNNCYSDFRWLDSYTSDDAGGVFNIADFIRCFQDTFESIGYSGDARNIGLAGTVRLSSLANLFDNYHSIPIADILTKPTLIELAAIENSDQKALLIALLLLSVLSYVNSNYTGSGELRNVILLEEAHVLLGAKTDAAPGEADPAAVAQSLVRRMLAELRSYGVSLVIADQSPKAVTADIVALTDIKLAFRLVEADDRQIIADSTNMDAVSLSRLGKLRPGEAYLFFGKLEEPEEVVTPDYRLAHQIDISLADDDIARLSTYWLTRADKLRPYPQCALTPYCPDCCVQARRELAREIARRLFGRHFKASTASIEPLRKVLGGISRLVAAELNDEPFDRELVSCVKVHLFRRIKYGCKLALSDTLVENSLAKE